MKVIIELKDGTTTELESIVSYEFQNDTNMYIFKNCDFEKIYISLDVIKMMHIKNIKTISYEK